MYHFIVNRHGGGGRTSVTWNSVERLLKQRGVAYSAHETAGAGDATRFTESLFSLCSGQIYLVVVGGDGTINEVLNGVADFGRFHLGVIPAGSGNDFARGLGIQRRARRALDAVLASKAASYIDIGQVTFDSGARRVFGISCGAGMDAAVCKRAMASRLKTVLNALGLGGLTYVFLTLYALFGMKATGATVSFDSAKPMQFKELIFFAAMNMKAEGGGVKMSPQAKPDDGMLSSCAASGIHKRQAFLLLPLLAAAKHEKACGFHLQNFRRAEITLDEARELHTDGEYCGDERHIFIDCLPQKLSMMI